MNSQISEIAPEFALELEKVGIRTELPTKPAKHILFHVYRSVDGQPDMEGMLAPFALALLLSYQMSICEGEWETPNVLFGADLREISNGEPLYNIYAKQFIRELDRLGLPLDCCNIFTPDLLEKHPVGTLTELTAFDDYKNIFDPNDEQSTLIFSRKPHQKRIKYLAGRHNIKSDFLSVEDVISQVFTLDGSPVEQTLTRYFPDTKGFERAEIIKRIFMLVMDGNGEFLEYISRFSKFKNALLNLGGHKS